MSSVRNVEGCPVVRPAGLRQVVSGQTVSEVAVQKAGDRRQRSRDHRQICWKFGGAIPGSICVPTLGAAATGMTEDVAQIAENNELHVVVLDEFDAIARVRSDGKKSDTATRDSVVNQLLVLMDSILACPCRRLSWL